MPDIAMDAGAELERALDLIRDQNAGNRLPSQSLDWLCEYIMRCPEPDLDRLFNEFCLEATNDA